MQIFKSQAFAIILDALAHFRAECDDARQFKNSLAYHAGVGGRDLSSMLPDIEGCMAQAEKACEATGMGHAHALIHSTVAHWKYDAGNIDFSSVAADLRNAKEAIEHELWQRHFVQVNPAYLDCVDNPLWFGKKVGRAFPRAVSDITEAGNCLAIECPTASVFHLMRAVEWSLRALCVHLGVTRVRRSRKPKQVKYTPIAFADWDKMLDAVQVRVDAKVNALAPGKRKQKVQELYYPLLHDLKGFKDAWRNHVMHTRSVYTMDDAGAILGHVKRFMVSLAEEISE
jgi:hypothetical protein